MSDPYITRMATARARETRARLDGDLAGAIDAIEDQLRIYRAAGVPAPKYLAQEPRRLREILNLRAE